MDGWTVRLLVWDLWKFTPLVKTVQTPNNKLLFITNLMLKCISEWCNQLRVQFLNITPQMYRRPAAFTWLSGLISYASSSGLRLHGRYCTGPDRVPRGRPSVQGPPGPTPYPTYLLLYIWAAMSTICETVAKQMLFFHLWNQVFGEKSAFWWAESSRWVWSGGQISSHCITCKGSKAYLIITFTMPAQSYKLRHHFILHKVFIACMWHAQTVLMRICGLSKSFVSHLLLIAETGVGMHVRQTKVESNNGLSRQPHHQPHHHPHHLLSRTACLSLHISPTAAWQAMTSLLSIIHTQRGWRGQEHTLLHMVPQHSTELLVHTKREQSSCSQVALAAMTQVWVHRPSLSIIIPAIHHVDEYHS